MSFDLDFDRYWTNTGIYREYTVSASGVQSPAVFTVPHDWRVRFAGCRLQSTGANATIDFGFVYPYHWLAGGSTIGFRITEDTLAITNATEHLVGSSEMTRAGRS